MADLISRSEAVVTELMKLRDRSIHGECYRDREELSCTLGSACRDCYEEKVRELLQIERKE